MWNVSQETTIKGLAEVHGLKRSFSDQADHIQSLLLTVHVTETLLHVRKGRVNFFLIFLFYEERHNHLALHCDDGITNCRDLSMVMPNITDKIFKPKPHNILPLIM